MNIFISRMFTIDQSIFLSKGIPNVKLNQVGWSVFACAPGLFGMQLEHVSVDRQNV